MSDTTKIKGGIQLEAVDIGTISNPKNNSIVLDSNDNKLKKYNESLDLWEEIASGVVCSGPTPVVFNIANDQSTEANITGLIIDVNEATTFDLEYVIRRSTDDNSVSQKGVFSGVYDLNDSVWYKSDTFAGLNAGVDFFIDNSTGQISYTSTEITGANYTGSISYVLKTNKSCSINIDGDVTGALGQTKVEAIQNVPVPAPTAGDDGKALSYNDSTGEFEYLDLGLSSLLVEDKGDILTGDGTDPVVLPVGSVGQVLAAAPSTATGLRWENRQPNANLVINGNFDFWQRGTSLSAGTGLRRISDRWRLNSAGTTLAISRQTFTLGQTNVPNNPTYFKRVTVASSAGVNNFARVDYLVESVSTFAGKTATLSFWIKADSNKTIALEFAQNFGTSGFPSPVVIFNPTQTKYSVTSSWQKITCTINIPSIATKTLGTDNNDRLEFIIWLDAGSNLNARTDSLGHQSGTFDIAQVKLEEGSFATDFVLAGGNIEGELAACQRYYEVIGRLDLHRVSTVSEQFKSIVWQFKTTKRVSATVTIGSSVNAGTPTVSVSGVDYTRIGATDANAGATSLIFDLTADAEL